MSAAQLACLSIFVWFLAAAGILWLFGRGAARHPFDPEPQHKSRHVFLVTFHGWQMQELLGVDRPLTLARVLRQCHEHRNTELQTFELNRMEVQALRRLGEEKQMWWLIDKVPGEQFWREFDGESSVEVRDEAT